LGRTIRGDLNRLPIYPGREILLANRPIPLSFAYRLGQADDKSAASARLAFGTDGTTKSRGDPVDHGQTQTDARLAEAAGLLRTKKRLEQVR
jgi:hypothetical protein